MQVDLCIKANHLFTGESTELSSGCVLVSGGKIVDVISLEEGEKYIGKNTEVIEAGEWSCYAGLY